MSSIKADPRNDTVAQKALIQMRDTFEDTFKSLKKTTPGNMRAWTDLSSRLATLLNVVAVKAYLSACDEAEVHPDTMTTLKFKRSCYERAQQTTGQMRDWTLKSLGIEAAQSIKQKKKRLLGGDRAENAAQHEVRNIYFEGKIKGWSQNKEMMKQSVTSGQWHDQDDVCDDIEDEGFIPAGEAFSTGDLGPPYHFGCYCYLMIRQVRG